MDTRPSWSRSAAGCGPTAAGRRRDRRRLRAGARSPRRPPARSSRRGPTGSATVATRSAASLPARALTSRPCTTRSTVWSTGCAGVPAAGRPRPVTLELRPAAAARLPVAAAAAYHLARRPERPARRPRGDQPGRAAGARSASPPTRTCACPGSGRRAGAAVPGPDPAAGRRPAAADRRGPGGRQRVRLHRAPQIGTPSWTPPSATWSATPTAARRDAGRAGRRTRRARSGRTGEFGWWQVLHQRHAAAGPAPPRGRDRADDLPAGRVPLGPRPHRARAGPDLAGAWGITHGWRASGAGSAADGVRRGGPPAPDGAQLRPRPAGAAGGASIGCSSTRSGRPRPGSPRAGRSWCWRSARTGTGSGRPPRPTTDVLATVAGEHANRAVDHRGPHSNKSAYLDRYAEPDKGWTDRDESPLAGALLGHRHRHGAAC